MLKSSMIRIGNFFFRYRNRAFPLVIVALFILAIPPFEIDESKFLERVKDFLAITIACLGLLLRAIVIGYAYIKRGGMNKKVYARDLVTEGMFALCRNPLYVGNILIYSGVFLMHGNPWVLVLGTGFFIFIYHCIVAAEEAYLEDKFGDSYRRYCAEVPRWIPKFSRFREATEGMEFNLKRVILKDYTTIATTVIMLALTEEYEYIFSAEASNSKGYMLLILGIILASGVWTLSVRTLKKRAA